MYIIHFNDAHNIQESEKENEIVVGGAARFITAIQSKFHLKPLVLFSGDLFSPSHCKFIFFVY